MPLIKHIIRGPHGWNTLTYTDDSKYTGYTLNDEIRNGLGTLYAADNSILMRGVWENDELIEKLEEVEYNAQVNQTMQHTPHW